MRLTQCNHCSLIRITMEAKRTKRKVLLVHGENPVGSMEGVDVYVVAPSVSNLRKLDAMSEVDRKRCWVSWFGSLTDRCCC